MGSSLFVSHQKVLYPTLAFRDVQSVVNGENRSPGVAKNRVDAVATQGIHQGGCA